MNAKVPGVTAACYRFGAELQAYLEGEDIPFVPTHAQECAACALLLEELGTLRALARGLPLEDPSPAVWSSLRARLAAEGAFAEKVGFWTWFGQLEFLRHPVPVAAFACLLVLGCVMAVPRTYPGVDVGASPARSGRGSVQAMSFLGDNAALEQLVRDLEATFKAREPSLAPDLQATYENSLLSLDASIRECSDSLRREPDNTLAHDYLLAAYSQKAEVLSSALELDDGR
jgi:hypothetical protein